MGSRGIASPGARAGRSLLDRERLDPCEWGTWLRDPTVGCPAAEALGVRRTANWRFVAIERARRASLQELRGRLVGVRAQARSDEQLAWRAALKEDRTKGGTLLFVVGEYAAH